MGDEIRFLANMTADEMIVIALLLAVGVVVLSLFGIGSYSFGCYLYRQLTTTKKETDNG